MYESPIGSSSSVTGPYEMIGSAFTVAYRGAVVKQSPGRWLAGVRCARCGIQTQREWSRYDLARAYMEAGIEMARTCTGQNVDVTR